MGLFENIGDQAFVESPQGKRLFYRWSPWFRPYIIPDQAIEKRLLLNQERMREILAGCIVFQPVFFIFIADNDFNSIWFLAHPVLSMAAIWLGGYFLFRRDLANLERTSRMQPRLFYVSRAKRLRTGDILLHLFFFLLFVVGGLWFLTTGLDAVIGWSIVVLLAGLAAEWGYVLYLRATCQEPPS